MGYAIYQMYGRDCGYSVPAVCEFPTCNEEIDRGMSYACGGEPDSEHGCGNYFCGKHMQYAEAEDGCHAEFCDRCAWNIEHGDGGPDQYRDPYPQKPDILKWVIWKLLHESWGEWRKNNPDELKKMWLRFDSIRLSELEPVLKELAEWGLFDGEGEV